MLHVNVNYISEHIRIEVNDTGPSKNTDVYASPGSNTLIALGWPVGTHLLVNGTTGVNGITAFRGHEIMELIVNYQAFHHLAGATFTTTPNDSPERENSQVYFRDKVHDVQTHLPHKKALQ